MQVEEIRRPSPVVLEAAPFDSGHTGPNFGRWCPGSGHRGAGAGSSGNGEGTERLHTSCHHIGTWDRGGVNGMKSFHTVAKILPVFLGDYVE